MFSPIAISLSPNTEKDDTLLALKLLFSPWRWRKGSSIEELEKEFARYLGVKFAVSFNSGRTAELAILKCLGIREDEEVLLQAFTCVVVPNSILWLKAKPVYVDIEGETFNLDPEDLEKKITPEAKAIIVQHTFGQPANLDKIQAIAKKHDLFVIEDCAHSLGAKFQGKFSGTFGGAAFFSFGRDKVISSVFGGMAVTNDEKLAQKLKEYQKKLPFPSAFWIFQQLLHPLAFNLLIWPFYNFFSLGKAILFLMQKLGLLSFPVRKKEKLGFKSEDYPTRLPNALAALAAHQFKKLARFNTKRMRIAKLYDQNLKKTPLELPKIKTDSIVFRYSIKTVEARKLFQFAKKRGVLLGNWYANVIDPEGVNFDKIEYKRGSCPVAESVAPTVINLPTHPKMRKRDVLQVIALIKEYFDNLGK